MHLLPNHEHWHWRCRGDGWGYTFVKNPRTWTFLWVGLRVQAPNEFLLLRKPKL